MEVLLIAVIIYAANGVCNALATELQEIIDDEA